MNRHIDLIAFDLVMFHKIKNNTKAKHGDIHQYLQEINQKWWQELVDTKLVSCSYYLCTITSFAYYNYSGWVGLTSQNWLDLIILILDI